MLKSRDSLANNEVDILMDKKKAREDLEATEELLSDATSKLHDVLSASTVNRQSVSVATMREQATQKLKVVSEKRKSLDTKSHIQASSNAIPQHNHQQKKI